MNMPFQGLIQEPGERQYELEYSPVFNSGSPWNLWKIVLPYMTLNAF